MKKLSTGIFAASALMLAACALAAGVGRVEYVTADLAKRTATVSWTWTGLSDNAVRLSLMRNGEDFPTAGWGGTLFLGDGAMGCAVAGTPNGYNELLFDVERGNVPTNGKYAVQIIATNTAGRVEEWARGTLTVRANPSAGGMPTNWSAYAELARKVAPYIDAQGILSAPANSDALWNAVSNRTDALTSDYVGKAVAAASEAATNYADAALASKADASALSAYATSNDLSSVASSVSAVWEQVFGESVWIAVTNYMRTTDAKPSMGLWEKRDGATNLVWSSAEEIGARTDAVRAELADAVAEARAAADSARAWGRWQSADGAGAPDGFTMVTTPYLMMTGGGAWEQRTFEGGSYWLFCGAGGAGGTADGAFRMLDSQGASVFEVTAGSVREVPAVPSSFRVIPDGDSPGYNSVTFTVNATSPPKVYWTTDLAGTWAEVMATDHELSWRRLDDTTYEFYFKISRDYESAFFKAVYETGAEPVVDFKRPLRLSRVELGGTNYAVSVGVMSDGTKFLKLEGE